MNCVPKVPPTEMKTTGLRTNIFPYHGSIPLLFWKQHASKLIKFVTQVQTGETIHKQEEWSHSRHSATYKNYHSDPDECLATMQRWITCLSHWGLWPKQPHCIKPMKRTSGFPGYSGSNIGGKSQPGVWGPLQAQSLECGLQLWHVLIYWFIHSF